MISALPRPLPIGVRRAFVLLLLLFALDVVLGAVVAGLAAAFGLPRTRALELMQSTPLLLLASLGSTGLVLGWMFLRSSGLTITMVGHAINNAVVTGLSASGLEIPGVNAPPVSGVLQLQPWWLDVLGLVLTVAGILIFRRLTPTPPDRPPEPPVLIATTGGPEAAAPAA